MIPLICFSLVGTLVEFEQNVPPNQDYEQNHCGDNRCCIHDIQTFCVYNTCVQSHCRAKVERTLHEPAFCVHRYERRSYNYMIRRLVVEPDLLAVR